MTDVTTRITGTDGKQYDVTYTLTAAVMTPATVTVKSIVPVAVIVPPPPSSLVAPTITNLRAVSAASSNPVWNHLSGSTAHCNNLNAFGKSSPGATVSVYVDGTLKGTTAADSSGNWKRGLGILSDATHSITATATSGGQTSAQSAAFSITVVPNITNFSTTPSTALNIFGKSYEVQTAGKSYSITSPDTHTTRHEVHQGENWSTSDGGSSCDRSELAGYASIVNDTIINATFEFYLEPGITNSSTSWYLFWQLHSQSAISPAFYIGLSGPNGPWNNAAGDYLTVMSGWWNSSRGALDNSNVNWMAGTPPMYTSPAPIPRGTWHNIEIEMRPNNQNPAVGYIKVWCDGLLIVNYTGLFGFGENFYVCEDIYRDSRPEVSAIQIRNHQLMAQVA